jgi:hypothetical protein
VSDQRSLSARGFEYGVLYVGYPDEPHRSNMTEDEARTWVAEWIESGAEPTAVVVIRRPLGVWERV